MSNSQNIELYNMIIKLLEFVENEDAKYKYDFDDISKKIFLKDILNKLHDLRRLIEKQFKESVNV